MVLADWFFPILLESKLHGGLPKKIIKNQPTIAMYSVKNHFPIENANLDHDDHLDHNMYCRVGHPELEIGGYLTRCAGIAASIALNYESLLSQSHM